MMLLVWALVFFEHYFRGFDHRGDFVAHFQLHFIDAALGDYAFDQVLSHLYDDVGHDAAKLDFGDFAFQTISCG
jgi:hypothetical protein